MDTTGSELTLIAPTSLSRHVDFPEEFRVCPDEVGRSSQFWARKFARRQEPTPPRAPVGDDYSGGGDATEVCTACGAAQACDPDAWHN